MKLKSICFIVCLLSWVWAVSQTVTPTSTNDTNKVISFNTQARDLIIKGEYVSADSVAQLAYKLSQTLHYQRGVFNSETQIGVIYWYQDNYPLALQFHLNALKVATDLNNKTFISRANANVGLVFVSQREYDKALGYYIKALNLQEEIGNNKGFII